MEFALTIEKKRLIEHLWAAWGTYDVLGDEKGMKDIEELLNKIEHSPE